MTESSSSQCAMLPAAALEAVARARTAGSASANLNRSRIDRSKRLPSAGKPNCTMRDSTK